MHLLPGRTAVSSRRPLRDRLHCLLPAHCQAALADLSRSDAERTRNLDHAVAALNASLVAGPLPAAHAVGYATLLGVYRAGATALASIPLVCILWTDHRVREIADRTTTEIKG